MLYLLLVERKKIKKRNGWGLFSQGKICLAGCATQDFPGC
jgi:hypothetical protein